MDPQEGFFFDDYGDSVDDEMSDQDRGKLVKIDQDQYQMVCTREFHEIYHHRRYLLEYVTNIINEHPQFTGTIYVPPFAGDNSV